VKAQAQNCAIEFVSKITNIPSPTGVATDSSDNVYVADFNTGTVLKYSPTGTLLTTIGAPGQFVVPFGVAADNNGNVIVVENGANQVHKLSSTGTTIFTIGMFGPGNGEFDGPTFVATDAAGNIYVSDSNNNRVQKFGPAGNYLTQWPVNAPAGIAVAAAGNVFVVEQGTNTVRKFTITGTPILSWGGTGAGNGQFDGARGIAVDGNGDVYVVDTNNQRVQKFTNNGLFITQFGTPGAADGQFDNPTGIAVDAAGNIYVGDLVNERVQKFRQVCPSNVSAQRAGSVLVFPYYTSKAATKADTRMTISNISSAASTVANQAYVHLFFVDGTTCAQADLFLCLTPNASFSFKASEYDPEATGWLLAVAVNQAGTPIQNNTLIGNAFVTDGNYVDNYGAESFWANFAQTATVNPNGTATLRFDGSGYERVPNEFAAEIQSPVDVAGQRIVTAGLNGDLTTGQITGAAQAGTALVYNGNEKPFGSFSAFLNGNCQALATITTSSPRVPNGMAVMIPSGQTGWMRVKVGGAVGLIMTPRTATWKGIRALHKISYTTATLTISTFRPVC
jgi:sugar lactone lactonase YvrE